MPVTVLVEMDKYWRIVGSDIRRIPPPTKAPVAIFSLFGYIVSGTKPIIQGQSQDVLPTHLALSQKEKSSKLQLDQSVEQFWTLECLGIMEV